MHVQQIALDAIKTLRQNKSLWLFGFSVAIAGGTGGTRGPGGGGGRGSGGHAGSSFSSHEPLPARSSNYNPPPSNLPRSQSFEFSKS